jgi:hypothetical protein
MYQLFISYGMEMMDPPPRFYTQEHSRHKSLLQDIGQTIEASAVPVHIWKVKSHIGIVRVMKHRR